MSGNQNHNLEDDMIISGEGIVLSCCYHNQSIFKGQVPGLRQNCITSVPWA